MSGDMSDSDDGGENLTNVQRASNGRTCELRKSPVTRVTGPASVHAVSRNRVVMDNHA